MQNARHALNARIKIQKAVAKILRENSEYYQSWYDAWLASQSPGRPMPTHSPHDTMIIKRDKDHSATSKVA
jgi:hypothetical protein